MTLRVYLRAKIHRATVTGADADYMGSIAIDADLMRRAGFGPFERVSVSNLTTGEEIETYAIPAEPLSGKILLNGAAARRFRPGNSIIIAAWTLTDGEPAAPRMVLVDAANRYAGDIEPVPF